MSISAGMRSLRIGIIETDLLETFSLSDPFLKSRISELRV